MTNRGAPWTEEDERVIILMLQDNNTLQAIADRLGRSEGAVLARMEQMAYNRQKFLAAKKVLLNV